MEAFDLTLNQVNFEAEEHDISPTNKLHSFSNLVAFDSDLDGNEGEGGLPVVARRFRKATNTSSEAQQMRSQSSLAELAQIRGSGVRFDETDPIKNEAAPPSFDPPEKSLAFAPSKDSFQAFTMTVEALALQRSVIGGSNILPASAEEVAKAIKAAQQKIQGQGVDVPENMQHSRPCHRPVVQNGCDTVTTMAPSTPLTAAVKDSPSNVNTPSPHQRNFPHMQNNEVMIVHSNDSEQPAVILKSAMAEKDEGSKRVKFEDDHDSNVSERVKVSEAPEAVSSALHIVCAATDMTETSVQEVCRDNHGIENVDRYLNVGIHGQEYAAGTSNAANVDKSLNAGMSAGGFARHASMDSDFSVASNTDMSNLGSLQTTPRHTPRKQQLVPIKPEELDKVTAKSRRLGSDAIKSEDIRPAVLPSHAQSLVLPDACPDDLCMKKRVEQWLYSEAYQGGKEEKRSKKKKNKRSMTSSEESSPITDKPTTISSSSTIVHNISEEPSSETYPSVTETTHVEHTVAIGTTKTVEHKSYLSDNVHSALPQSGPQAAIPSDEHGTEYQSKAMQIKETIQVKAVVHQTDTRVAQEVIEDMNVDEGKDVNPTGDDDGAMAQVTPVLDSGADEYTYELKPITKRDLEKPVVATAEVPLKAIAMLDCAYVDSSTLAPSEISPAKNQTHELSTHGSPEVDSHNLVPQTLEGQGQPTISVVGTQNGYYMEHVTSVEVKVKDPHPVTDNMVNGKSNLPEQLIGTEVKDKGCDPKQPPSLELNCQDDNIEGYIGVEGRDVEQNSESSFEVHDSTSVTDFMTSQWNLSHVAQVPLQASTPVKPYSQPKPPAKYKKEKEKKKTKQYFMNKAKEVEADLESDEWSTKIEKTEISQPTSQRKRTSSQSSSHKGSQEKNTSHSLSAMKAELVKVTRQKAKLEGQLEVIEQEARTAISERAKLQAHVAAMAAQLRTQEESRQRLEYDQRHLKTDIAKTQDGRQRLERVIMDAQKLLEEKDMELKALQDDLTSAHQTNDKLQEKVKVAQQDVLAKDTNIQALKGKIAEVYVEFQTTNQAKILCEGEVKSLQSEVKSLTSQREWYQEQLQLSQEAKLELQRQITTVHADHIGHGTVVERLKADNARVRHQLSETQQKALQDKELLARHLETIQADMMEREVAFAQLKQQQEHLEKMMPNLDAANAPLTSVGASSAASVPNTDDLQEDLRKLKNETRRKDSHIFMLEHEKSELVKRITLSQEGILERDKTIESVERKIVDLEVENQNLHRESWMKNEELRKVRDLKNAIEIELGSAREEKRTFDDTLRTIKFDMGKVVNNFIQMKQDMLGKNTELEQVMKENNELKQKIEDMLIEFEKEKRQLIRDRRASEVGNSQITMEGVTRLNGSAFNSTIAKEGLKKSTELEKWKQIEEENTNTKLENQRISEELAASKEKLLELDVEVLTLLNEKTKLKSELDKMNISDGSREQLQLENQQLQDQIAQLQQESHQQIMQHKTQAKKLVKDVENLQQDLHQRQASYERSLEEASNTIASLQETRLYLRDATPNHSTLTECTQGDSYEEKPDNSQDIHSTKTKGLSIPEVNMRMKEDMQRTVEFIESQYKAQEQDMQEKLEKEIQKVVTAEENISTLEEKLMSLQKQLEYAYVDKEKEIQQQLEEFKKRAEIADETTHVLKAELEGLIVKISDDNSATGQTDLAEVVDKLAEERQLRAELEVELGSVRAELCTYRDKEKHSVNTETSTDFDTLMNPNLNKRDASVEEVNQKMQEDMTRAIAHIESQFQEKEREIKRKLDLEKARADQSEQNYSQLDSKHKEDLDKLQTGFDQEKSDLNIRLQEVIKKKQIAEESAKIMKEEMDKLALRFTETEPQLADSVNKLTAEKEARIQLETELEAIRVNPNNDKFKSVNSDIEHKLEQLSQRLLSPEEQSCLDKRLGSGDNISGNDALVIKLSVLVDQLSARDIRQQHLEGDELSARDIRWEHLEAVKTHVPRTSFQVPYMLDDVLSRNQELEAEKWELQNQIKALIKQRDENRHLLGNPTHVTKLSGDIPESLDKQVDIFMNRDCDIPKDFHGDIYTKECVYSPDVKHITEIIEELQLSSDVKQNLEKDMQVFFDAAVSERVQQMAADLASARERLRALSQLRQEPQGCDADQDPEMNAQLLQKLKLLQGEYADLLDTHEMSSEAAAKEIEALRNDYDDTRKMLAEKEAALMACDASSNLMLDLEREKGRLAGVIKTHDALKEHTHVLETTLAQRESSVAQMSTHVQEELIRKERRCKDLMTEVEKLKSLVSDEKKNAKESKKLLLTEKGKHVKLRRQMEEIWMEQDHIRNDLQHKDAELAKVNLEVEKIREMEITARLEAERMRADCHGNKLEVERLRRELKDRKSKDPIMQEQVQTLEWTLGQKEAELAAVHNQLQSAHDRHQMELENMQKTIQGHAAEGASLRGELTAITTQRSNLQARIAELKGALESSLTQAKMMKSQRRAQKEIMEKEMSNPVPPLPFDMAGLEKLLQGTSAAAADSKPLNFLQSTLSELRGEISVLQQQVDLRVGDVEVWKEIEAQVLDLRSVCQSSASSRDEDAKQVAIVTKNMEPNTTVTKAPVM